MGVTASREDKDAYAKIGGAMDNISDAYVYVAKGLSIVDSARDPLRNSGKLAQALKIGGKGQKVYSYVRKVQELLDEKKRDGAILKLGLKVSMDVAAKLLGTSLTTHPYYAYHKAQIEVLADVLNASSNSNAAVEAYKKAIAAADSKAVSAAFKQLESRKVTISAAHSNLDHKLIGIAADIARGMYADSFAKQKIAQFGKDKLAAALEDLESWRAMWSGLAFQALQLQIMAGSELNAAAEAMAKYNELMKSMMEGSNAGRIGGYGAQNKIDWEKYEQVVNQNKSSTMVDEPVKFAEGTVAKAEAWATAIAEMCDFVRSTDAIFPSLYNKQLDKLNRVLYG